MYRRGVPARSFLAGALLVACAATATGADIVDVRWDGSDLMLRLSDSVPFRVDLNESDTNLFVLRLSDVVAPATLSTTLNGPDGRAMILTRADGNSLRMTLTSPDRMGYATNWRPYSKTLVVHTFRWTQLGFAQEQYVKGLLAIEQRLDVQGIEFLRLAHAAGDIRAASVLGPYYARRNEFALAAQYLSHPTDADDYAALAVVKRAMGDTVAALEAEKSSRQLLERRTAGGHMVAPVDSVPASSATEKPLLDRMVDSGDLPIVLAVIGGVVLVILLIVVVVRRPLPRADAHALEATPTSPSDPRPDRTSYPTVAHEPPTMQAPVGQPNDDTSQPTIGATASEATAEGYTPPRASTGSTIDAAASTPVGAKRGDTALLSQQASELRQRIDALRAQQGGSESQDSRDDQTIDQAIVEEARRLHMSRDSVELRNRLHKAR